MARRLTAVVFLVAAASVAQGCREGGAESGRLAPEDVVPVLQSLPFKVHVEDVAPPSGDVAAFRGVAKRAGVAVHFSVGVGDPAVAVPIPGFGVERAIGEGSLGFSFNSDANFIRAFERGSDWYKAVDTAVWIEERLCKEASGGPCSI